MNHREPPTLPVGVRRALRCFGLLLVPALTLKTHSLPRARLPADRSVPPVAPESQPYLPVFGPPPLRFERPTPPPDLVTHPAASAPPIPTLSPTESTVAQANAAAAQTAPSPVRFDPPESKTPFQKEPLPAAAKPAPSAVLPDDTRPHVRPEDFLPFFQVPGTSHSLGRVNVVAPAPVSPPSVSPLPASSATYTQTPK